MADEELRMALEAFTALREVGRPADLYVFPDEHHIKWQPAHRLAAYRRGIDWFRYWLRGELPVAGRRREEALRWQAMDRRLADLSQPARAQIGRAPAIDPCFGVEQREDTRVMASAGEAGFGERHLQGAPVTDMVEIGRAACRESGCQYV